MGAKVHSGYFVLTRLMEKHRLGPPAVVVAGCGAGNRVVTCWAWLNFLLAAICVALRLPITRLGCVTSTQHSERPDSTSRSGSFFCPQPGSIGFGVNAVQLVLKNRQSAAKHRKICSHKQTFKKEICDEISPSNTQDKQNTLLHFLDCHGDADESVSNICSFGLKKD